MQANRATVAVVVAFVLLAGGWWLFSRSAAVTELDLIEQFDTATKQPDAERFEITEAELNGETRRAIYAPPPTRLTWRVQIPADAWLRVAVGMREESWTEEGDGALFFVGVSDGRVFDQLFMQHVNPFVNAGDRKWIPVWVDLSAYAGEEVDLVFNTRTSMGDADDPRNDHPLWGEPQIVVR